ncbi:hypothetical protein C2E23DRAFT_332601 [Lenzites betulinus]|nr:hypothetical protein C2E23DRAFT_332601 [Lenzites betulinus]
MNSTPALHCLRLITLMRPPAQHPARLWVTTSSACGCPKPRPVSDGLHAGDGVFTYRHYAGPWWFAFGRGRKRSLAALRTQSGQSSSLHGHVRLHESCHSALGALSGPNPATRALSGSDPHHHQSRSTTSPARGRAALQMMAKTAGGLTFAAPQLQYAR